MSGSGRYSLSAAVTGGVAIAVGALGMLGVVDQTVLSGATLAVLALIAFDLVKTQRQTLRNIQAMGQLTDAVTGVTRPAPIGDVLDASTPASGLVGRPLLSLELIGVTLGRTVRTALPDLKSCLDAGALVRIALIDPDSGAPREAARRNGVADDEAIFEHRLRATLDMVHYLAATAAEQGRLEVRLIPFVPSVGITAIDRHSRGGTISVDVYSHRPDAPEPSFTVSADRDTHWYTHFSSEIDQIWTASQPVVPASIQSRGNTAATAA